MAAYTLYWKRETVERYIDRKLKDLWAGLSDQFSSRGVQPGSLIYPVQVQDGRLGVICRFRVARLGRNVDPPDPEDGWREMAVAEPSSVTRLRLRECFLSDDAVGCVRFQSDLAPELQMNDGRVYWQCLRTMRKITPETQQIFDEYLREPDYAGAVDD